MVGVMVRCTAKALQLLGIRASLLPVVEPLTTTEYMNLLWFDRRECLLLTHAGTCFSVFAPDIRKADLDPIGPFLAEAITAALEDEALPHNVLGALDPGDTRIAKTASKRVLGVMNEIAYHLDYMLDRYGSVLDVDVITVNRQLQRTLHSHGRDYARPIDLARKRITESGP